MRKILSFCIIALTLLSACSKQKEVDNIDYQKVEEVLNFKGNPAARVVAFNILSPVEKAYAFKKHIQDNYEKLSLNDEQKNLVKYAIKMIVPEMYITEQKDKFLGAIAELGYKATQLFSLNDYVSLFQNIQPIKKTTFYKETDNVEPEETLDGGNDCYCAWDSTCTPYADTKGSSCVTGRGCTKTSSGCGWLWVSSCEGECGRK